MHHEPWQPREMLWNLRDSHFILYLNWSGVDIHCCINFSVQHSDSVIHICTHSFSYFFALWFPCLLCAQPHLSLCDAVDCSPWDSPGKKTGVGCHALLHGNPPDLGIELESPSLAGGRFNTEPPEKSITVPPRVFRITPCLSILCIIVWMCQSQTPSPALSHSAPRQSFSLLVFEQSFPRSGTREQCTLKHPAWRVSAQWTDLGQHHRDKISRKWLCSRKLCSWPFWTGPDSSGHLPLARSRGNTLLAGVAVNSFCLLCSLVSETRKSVCVCAWTLPLNSVLVRSVHGASS